VAPPGGSAVDDLEKSGCSVAVCRIGELLSEDIRANRAARSRGSTRGAVVFSTAVLSGVLVSCDKLESQMAIDINLQQLFGKEVPLGLGRIFPARDVREVRSVVFVAEILLYKLGELMWGKTENLVD
jgi:hypothetical protein